MRTGTVISCCHKGQYECIGVRGSNQQLNTKKVVVGSCGKRDLNNAVKNKKLLKAVLPHKIKTAKTKFVESCTERRADFERTATLRPFATTKRTTTEKVDYREYRMEWIAQ